jgi:hypothetical protein
VRQVPITQETFAPVQVLLAQQGWPGRPHAWQVPLMQILPELQVLLLQHG